VKIVNENGPTPPTKSGQAGGAKPAAKAPTPEEIAAKKAKEEADAKAAQDAKEKAAATRLQAVTRGNRDREKVELMKHACDHYRINMQAEEVCGPRLKRLNPRHPLQLQLNAVCVRDFCLPSRSLGRAFAVGRKQITRRRPFRRRQARRRR
jgi:hypothetical protein